MMLKLPVLQNFKINIGKYFGMNTSSMSGTQQHLLLHVNMLKVHLSDYPCQSKHNQSNVYRQYSRTSQANKKIHIQFLVQ